MPWCLLGGEREDMHGDVVRRIQMVVVSAGGRRRRERCTFGEFKLYLSACGDVFLELWYTSPPQTQLDRHLVHSNCALGGHVACSNLHTLLIISAFMSQKIQAYHS